jgi:hypothetical protein
MVSIFHVFFGHLNFFFLFLFLVFTNLTPVVMEWASLSLSTYLGGNIQVQFFNPLCLCLSNLGSFHSCF